ncbi:hypothetical protein N0Y54_42075 [Nostoc punctiforme UO1]
MPITQCPTPNAQRPMPNAQCPMPNAHYSKNRLEVMGFWWSWSGSHDD